MRKTATALCFAAALAVTSSVTAQQPGSAGPARNDGVTTSADTEIGRPSATDTLTLTGCLDRAANGTYELRKATMGNLGTRGATGTTGTTAGATGTSGASTAAAAAVDATPSTWILKSTTDLAPHVGHQVQVTGRPSTAVAPPSDTATTSPPTTTATGARMKDVGESARSVDVQAVRMISQSCS
jgi:hypothetical protein